MNRRLFHVDVNPMQSETHEPLQRRDDIDSRARFSEAGPTSDALWRIVEEGFTLTREHEIESLFAIANGYVGNRASLAEGTVMSAPATFLAGVFEQLDNPGSVPQLMVLPDWTNVRIWINHQPLSMENGEALHHRRILDLRHGVFWREWRHRDAEGRVTRVTAFRLASLADRHLLLHSVTLIPENYSSIVQFETSIGVAGGNVSLLAPGWKARTSPARPNILPLAVRVPGRSTTTAFGVTSRMVNASEISGTRAVEVSEDHIVEAFEVELPAGEACQLHRLISVFSSRESANPFQSATDHLQEAIPRGLDELYSEHVAAWEHRWRSADMVIEGDDFLQRAIRFAIYHLISAANPHDSRVSIGARALTGPAYKGHVFWDTEIYMLPFYTFTHPPSARALLEYRYQTLDAAREKASALGFRGALYPWESADTGEEVTPRVVIAPNGEAFKIRNGELEVHITADVAFGVWQFWQMTGDDDFLLRCGAEILLESARFWASRGAMESDGAYHIRHVIGPDEYHEDVDDNAYTNLMAAWTLRRGADIASLLAQRWPDQWRELSRRLQMTTAEVHIWRLLANATFTGFDPATLQFEQFAGYYQKQQIDLRKYEPRSAAMDLILGHERIQQTNVVKQADVVLAGYLLPDEIAPDVCAANFRYYEPRTGHGSSLSPCIHALMASRMGDRHLARRYLKQASEIDLGNNMGNAAGGVHAAALGGLWQALVFGFGGVKATHDRFSLAPDLLTGWRRLEFPIQWRGRTLRVAIEPRQMRVAVQGEGPVKLRAEPGFDITAAPGNEYVSELTEGRWGPWQETRERELR
jgi:trehalose/maltose hydrolase-like predicted phosphorylase